VLFCGVQSRELEPAWPLNLLMDCWRAIILQSRSRWKGELVIMTKTGMLSFAVLCGSAALAQTAAPKGQATSAVQSPPAAAPADSPGRKVASGHVSADYVFPYLSYYWSLPADRRSMFVPSYALTIDGHPPTGWSFFLKIGDTLKPIAVAPDGHIEELPTAQDLAGHPEVVMHVAPDQVGKRSISTNISTTPLITPALEIDAAKCALAIEQVNGAVPKAARMMGLVPTIKAVGFNDAGSGVAVLDDGRTVPLPLSQFGAPMYDPKKIPGAKLIRLDKVPSRIIMI
jgi:hypothetical protein